MMAMGRGKKQVYAVAATTDVVDVIVVAVVVVAVVVVAAVVVAVVAVVASSTNTISQTTDPTQALTQQPITAQT